MSEETNINDENKLTNEANNEPETDKFIPSVLENKFADFTYKFVKYIPHTVKPNTITAIGFVGGLIGALCFYLGTFSRLFFIPAILGVISHIVCDNWDGYMARERNQKSASGAFFDLLSDIVVSTFVILFIGLSGYSSLIFSAFAAPLYGITMVVDQFYIRNYNEFPFPRIGPFEIHSSFVIVALLNMIFGRINLFTIGYTRISLVDIIMLLGCIGAYAGCISLAVKLFKRLNKDNK